MRYRELLTEGPQTQAGVEDLADRFLAAVCQRIAGIVNDTDQPKLYEVFQRTRVTFSDIVPPNTDTFSPTLIKFVTWLRDSGFCMMGVPQSYYGRPFETRGQFQVDKRHGTVELTFDLDEMWEKIVSHKPVSPETVWHLLQDLRHIVVHEMAHAFRKSMMGDQQGSHKWSQQTRAAHFALGFWPTPEKVKRAYDVYHADPEEVDAHFVSTVAKLEPQRRQMAWPAYLQAFQNEYDGWSVLRPSQRRSIIRRLAGQWQTGR